MSAQTEVMVIDAPHGAVRALEAYRPRRERTHLICRWPDELAPAFLKRVTRHLAKVRLGAEIVTLTLVLGGDAAFGGLLSELGQDLASMISPSGSLTLVCAGATQSEAVRSFELLRQLVGPSVSLDAWFPSA